MKLLFQIITFFLLVPLSSNAQNPPKQGVIIYDQVMKLREQMAKESPVLAQMMPEEMHVKMQVTFDAEKFTIASMNDAIIDMAQTLSTSVAKGSNTATTKDTTTAKLPKMDMDFPEERQMINLKKGLLRTETTLAGRDYYTETTDKKKVVVRYYTSTKKIAGYTCNRAFVQVDSTVYMVWYAPAIPFAYNPIGLELTTLKGAVLGYQMEGITCTALSVKAAGFKPADVTPNEKARQVTGEQMADLKADHMETLTKKMGGKSFQTK
jgi:GLPGLI family protein